MKKTSWLGLGVYPNVTLKRARELASEYREQIANGIHPKTYKDQQTAKRSNTVAYISTLWLEVKKHEFSASHYKQVVSRLNRFILPAMGNRQVDKITAPEVVSFLKSFEVKGHLEQRDKTKSHER